MSSKLGWLILASGVAATAAHADKKTATGKPVKIASPNAVVVNQPPPGDNITYTYDARGRLIRVAHTGTVNNNVATAYTYDNADNRTNVTTTGAP